jgi:hypothetical protein
MANLQCQIDILSKAIVREHVKVEQLNKDVYGEGFIKY